ncbi:MAG: 16S rRNA (cytosine(1402)-N(4))-methyltransferase RsmH [Candidatus Buchananbacteria bacterium]|nr:16S rRNA (cytosine(1402)-N(4))-methyltransferase RsmH [Candidatus Buchananbacteria bacterium]
MTTIHEPVLLQEILDGLNPQTNQNYVDCTFGGGGHSLAILEKVKPSGQVIGIDWDPTVVQNSQNENLILVNDNYRNLKKIINGLGISKINGILLDLGLSSDQLGSGARGFSFQSEGFLDLRYDPKSDRPTAADILRTYSEKELLEIFKNYGEEPLAWQITKKIITQREQGEFIETADMLVQLVSDEYRKKYRSRSKHNPATRVFQALRIAVNDEFGNIKNVLPDAVNLLAAGGRLAVISFHSGEDRIVKHFFKKEAIKEEPKIKIITKKPIIASENEIKMNPRSRSAKLRIIEKI